MLWIKKKLNNPFIKVYFFDMVSKLFTIVITILIIRFLTHEEYADYTVYNSIGSFISGVLGSGIGLAYTRYAVLLRQKKSGEDGLLYWILRKKMFFVVSLLFVTGMLVLVALGKFTYVNILGIIYGLLLSLYQLNVVFFQARERYSIGGVVSNVKNIVVALAVLVLFILKLPEALFPLLIIYISALFASLIFTTIYINNKLKIKQNDMELANTYLSAMFKDSIWIILYMFMLSAFNQLDVFILKYFRDSIEVASYGVAFKYYANILSLLPAIQVVLRVKNSSIEMAEDPRLRRESVIRWVKKASPLAIVLLVVGCIGAQIVFPVLNGKEYNSAIITFDILLIGACLSYVTAPNVSVMLAAGKQKTLFFLSIGSFLINFIGNILLIPKYGQNAAALTTILAHFFLNGGSTIILLIHDNKSEKVI